MFQRILWSPRISTGDCPGSWRGRCPQVRAGQGHRAHVFSQIRILTVVGPVETVDERCRRSSLSLLVIHRGWWCTLVGTM